MESLSAARRARLTTLLAASVLVLSTPVMPAAASAAGERVVFAERQPASPFFSISEGYRRFAALLRRENYEVEALTTAITSADLVDVDVLVIQQPRQLDPDEVEAALAFAAEGGGLFLISDVNRFSTPALNQIAGVYGITDGTEPVLDNNSKTQGNPSWPIISQFAPHPITEGVGPATFFFTSSQVLAPDAEAIGVAFSDADAIPPSVPVMVATPECARERVALIGDATLFLINQIAQPSHERLAWNTVDWLARRTPDFCVEIDIRPRREVNVVVPGSRRPIRVAILGSEVLDVTEVDRGTLAFGPEGAAPRGRRGGRVRDVNDDGFPDLVSRYRARDAGIAFGDTEACLTGEFLDGTPFESCDAIETLPGCGNGYELALLVPPLVWLGRRRTR